MENQKGILSTKEKPGVQEGKLPEKLPPEKRWYREMEENSRLSFWAMLIVDPVIVILFIWYISGYIVSILLTYLILDGILLWWWRKKEIKRLREWDELEAQGDRTEILRRKAAEFKEMYHELEAQGKWPPHP